MLKLNTHHEYSSLAEKFNIQWPQTYFNTHPTDKLLALDLNLDNEMGG